MEASQSLPAALIAAASAIAVALIMHWPMRRRVKATEEHAAAAREQVQNSHKTNLRDDMDVMRDILLEVRDEQRETRGDVRQVREDLAIERRERIAVAERVEELTQLVA